MTEYLSAIPYEKKIRPLLLIRLLGTFTINSYFLLILPPVLASCGDGASCPGCFLAAIAAAILLPRLLFMIPAGVCSDRITKRSVMQIAKLVEFILMILAAVAYTKFDAGNANQFACSWPVIAVFFFLSLQAAYFQPAFQGFLPELFQERDLSRANGDTAFASFAGGVLSVLILPVLYPAAETFCAWFRGKYSCAGGCMIPENLIGFLLVLLSLGSLFLTFQIMPTGAGAARRNRLEKAGSATIFARGCRALFGQRALLSSALGDALFALITLLLPFLGYGFLNNVCSDVPGTLDKVLFLTVPVLAVGFGCCVSGRRAKDKIELGYVLIGAIGFALFLSLAPLFFWNTVGTGKFAIHLPVLVCMTLAGFFFGFCAIPLRGLLQHELPAGSIGSCFAVSGVIRTIIVFLGLPLILSYMNNPDVPCEAYASLFRTVGLGALGITILAGLIMPWLFVRLMVLFLTHTFYKMRILGTENIPERGGVLFVSNHVSYIDSLMILACTSRRVRFLMSEKFYRSFWIHPFAKLMGVIPVPDGGAHKLETMLEEIRKVLAEGEPVCVFPEGRISANGIMGDFKAGYAMMLPEDGKVPIIPVGIGLVWGSMFTKYCTKLSLRLSSRIPYPATVSFGKPVEPTKTDTAFRLRQAVEELLSDAEIKYPRENERTLHYQLAKHAKRHPFRTVIYDQDGKEYSFFKVLLGSVILSRTVRNIVPEETKYVGVYLPNTPAATLSILGIMMADKVPSPLNFSVSRETLNISLKKAGITHVITSKLFLAKLHMEPLPEMVFLEDLAKDIPKYRKIFWTIAAILLPHQELMNIISPETHNDVSAIAVLLFSSGSTGIPKGIMLTHHNINSDINSLIHVMRIDPAYDSIVGSLPMFHSFGFTTCVWIPVMYGLKVAYILSPLDAAMVGKVMERYKLTVLLGTPTFMQSYMRKCSPEQFASLRLAIVGAEKLRRDIAVRFRELTGNRTALVEGYGCTELSPIAAINVSRGTEMVGKEEGKPGSIGVAMPGMCIRIVDPTTKQDLPPDADGLMMVKGPNVMKGYLNDPGLTANVLKDGWYDTGDIANMDTDGYVTISGRLSRFSKIAGEMVPHELLECIMNEIVGLEERVLAVGSIPDKAKGEALAVLVAKGKCPLTPEEITEKLREKGIPNLWIPRSQNYRETEEFPIMANGKMDLMKMREIIRKTFEA